MDVPDEELVRRYRTDPGAASARSLIDELFGRHHRRVAAWCYRMTGNIDLAGDLAQEIFLKAYQRLDSFRGESKFTTWLYTIARNHCMDELRARAATPDQTSETIGTDLEDFRIEDTFDALERRESETLARRLMAESLDELEAQVMNLHYVHELPLESVTRILRLKNASGAKAYIVSARRKLARAVELWRNREKGMRGGAHAK